MARLQGKTAIVTGGANGLGEATARLFVEEGAKVIVADIAEQGQAVADSLGQAALFQRLDVSDAEQWEAVVAKVKSAFGRLDILVNCAGISGTSSVADSTEKEFDRYVDINQRSIFLGMKYAAPTMAESGGGSIINFSSIWGLRGSPEAIHYPATKFAVRGLTRSAAYQLAPQGIRVNAILPGPINTAQMQVTGDTEAWIAQVAAMTALKRIGEPIEIARAVLFLASDDASFVTGSDLVVDGGMMA